MNQHPDNSGPGPDDGFDAIINGGYAHTPNTAVDQAQRPGPYGIPAHSIPHKAGLTRRGRVAIGVAAVAVVGSGLIWHQSSTAQDARNRQNAAAQAIEMKKLQLEELRLRNDQKTKDAKAHNSAQAALQASIDKCVKDSQHLVGKGYGSPSKGDVIADCRQQYGDDTSSAGMANAASSSNVTGTNGNGSGINSAGLLGLVAGGGLLVTLAARRGQRTD